MASLWSSGRRKPPSSVRQAVRKDFDAPQACRATECIEAETALFRAETRTALQRIGEKSTANLLQSQGAWCRLCSMWRSPKATLALYHPEIQFAFLVDRLMLVNLYSTPTEMAKFTSY